MCLKRANTDKPYNKSNIRWKVLYKRITDGSLVSDNAYNCVWKYGKKNTATCYPGLTTESVYDIGFHVFVSRMDARDFKYNNPHLTVVEVKVEGFIARGYLNSTNYRNETWKFATLIK